MAGSSYASDSILAFEPDAMEAMENLVMDSDLWAVDQRNGLFIPGVQLDGEVDLEAIQEQAIALTNAHRAIIDARIDARIAESAGAADVAATRASMVRYIATALLAIAATWVFFAALGQWRRSAELQRQVNIDPLTGVGNRNLLQSKTAGLLADPDLGHHTFVMIDMDRFKMVNDTYGHAAGDELLQEVASGLQTVAEQMNVAGTTVVRLGGDEFALTLHDGAPVDIDALTRHLSTLRKRSISIDDAQTMQISFSFGIANAAGSPTLEELSEAADLAAYEERGSRRHQHEPIDVTDSVVSD